MAKLRLTGPPALRVSLKSIIGKRGSLKKRMAFYTRVIVVFGLACSCLGAPTKNANDDSRMKGCISTALITKKSDCESLAQMCFVTKAALVANNPTVLNETVCTADAPLEVSSTWVCCDYEKQDSERKQQTLVPIIVPDVLGIGSGLGSSLLSGILDRGTGSLNCVMENVANNIAGFASIGFIGSPSACRVRCFFTLGCNFWTWNKNTDVCVLAADFRRVLSSNAVSGSKTCSILFP